MSDKLRAVQSSEPSRKGGWKMMARRRRAQTLVPKLVSGSWKVWYRTDEAQSDGSVRRVQKTKVLGRRAFMTRAEAKKAAAELVAPINNVSEGVEHRKKTMA